MAEAVREQWKQGECWPKWSKVVMMGAIQCSHLGIAHSVLELGRKWEVMMDAIQCSHLGVRHSVLELGRN